MKIKLFIPLLIFIFLSTACSNTAAFSGIIKVSNDTRLGSDKYVADKMDLAGKYDIETVVCYHGGLYRDDPNRRIAELARDGIG